MKSSPFPLSRTLAVALLCGTTALTCVSLQGAFAQANSSAAPLLPPPPTASLEPIPSPADSNAVPTPGMTPATNMNGTSQQPQQSTPNTSSAAPRPIGIAGQPATPAAAASGANQTPVTQTAQPTGPAPTAQNMGSPAATPQDTAPTAPAYTNTTTGNAAPASTNAPVPASELAGAPIALPGMPASESGLTATQTTPISANSIDPSLVGAANGGQGYDQAAYEERLKERLSEIKVEARQQALEQAKENTFPLQPAEIEALLQQLRTTQAAIQKPIERPPATPRAVVHTMELDPGAQPPTIQLLNGNVTSLSILDATGQPWPIVDIAFGGPFDVKPPETGGHVIRISPLKEYAHGNMSVRLQKLPTPLTFSLDAGGQEVHYRFDARIPKLGPNAKTSLIDRGLTITAGDDSSLSAILVGTPPASAERLKVLGVDGRTSAYRLDGATYVRTPLTLLSPTWQSSVSSADGTNVYKLNDAPVLLLSDQGTMVRAQIQQPVIDPFGLPDDQRALPQAPTTSAGVRG